MTELEELDHAIKLLKSLKNDRIKRDKLSDQLYHANTSSHTPKKMQALSASLNWACMNLDKSTTAFARFFRQSHLNVDTSEKTYRPSGFHEYKG